MKKVSLGARILLGLIFVVFGLNGFLQFLPVPPPATPAAQEFMKGLFLSGYFFPFLKTFEILGGLMILTGVFAPLGILILAPITLNIFMYHRFAAGGPPMDVMMMVLLAVAAWGYRGTFKGVLKAKAALE
jgi:uncharacterized membrane protein YphA (DoxX/SURF4 family)